VKILILHNKYKIPGGEDAVVLNEAHLLEEYGHDVKVFYFSNEDINGIVSKIKSGVNAFYSYKSKAEVKRVIESFSPDVIHVHNYFPKFSPSIFYLAKGMDIPIVQTIHNYRYICPGALLLRDENICELCISKTFALPAIRNRCYRNSYLETGVVTSINYVHNKLGTWQSKIDRLITLTEFAKQKFLESSFSAPKKKYIVKPNFVEDFGFNFERGDHFLFVGRLSKEKGIDILLNAFKSNHLPLVIVGGGPLEEEVRLAASRHENIIFKGYQKPEDVREQMKSCKALIFPSIWYEGMPMTILEAFSTGCPVVVSAIGGMAELVSDGYDGLHFEVGNSEDLILKLDSIELAMNRNARNTYEKKYSPTRNYQSLIEIYTQVIDEKATNN
jgi:glycosyltransferase involved in cell wall biosynthesis